MNLFSVETYLSPVETHCMNVDYFFLDPENQTHEFSEDAMTRLRMFKQITVIDNCLQFKKLIHLLSFRHGKINNRLIHCQLFRNVHRFLDRSRGLLEKITRKYHRHRNFSTIGM